MRNDAEDKPYKCKHCDKQFVRRDVFLNHELKHLMERPHECSECGKQFAVVEQFAQHEKFTCKKEF